MTSVTTFILLCVLGLINAGYLTYKHYKKEPLICPINHDCNSVTESKWGNLFGIRNEILGILFYTGMLAGVLFLTFSPQTIPNLSLYLLIGAGAGLLMSFVFTLIQIYAIRNYCFYCLISAFLNLLIFINSVILFF